MKAQVAISGNNAASVNFQTKREKLPELLDLIALILRHPTFPEAEAEEITTDALIARLLDRIPVP